MFFRRSLCAVGVMATEGCPSGVTLADKAVFAWSMGLCPAWFSIKRGLIYTQR
jgi:hypothetical protein